MKIVQAGDTISKKPKRERKKPRSHTDAPKPTNIMRTPQNIKTASLPKPPKPSYSAFTPFSPVAPSPINNDNNDVNKNMTFMVNAIKPSKPIIKKDKKRSKHNNYNNNKLRNKGNNGIFSDSSRSMSSNNGVYSSDNDMLDKNIKQKINEVQSSLAFDEESLGSNKPDYERQSSTNSSQKGNALPPLTMHKASTIDDDDDEVMRPTNITSPQKLMSKRILSNDNSNHDNNVYVRNMLPDSFRQYSSSVRSFDGNNSDTNNNNNNNKNSKRSSSNVLTRQSKPKKKKSINKNNQLNAYQNRHSGGKTNLKLYDYSSNDKQPKRHHKRTHSSSFSHTSPKKRQNNRAPIKLDKYTHSNSNLILTSPRHSNKVNKPPNSPRHSNKKPPVYILYIL